MGARAALDRVRGHPSWPTALAVHRGCASSAAGSSPPRSPSRCSCRCSRCCSWRSPCSGFVSAGNDDLAADLIDDLGAHRRRRRARRPTLSTRAEEGRAGATDRRLRSASCGPASASSARSSTCATGPGRCRAAALKGKLFALGLAARRGRAPRRLARRRRAARRAARAGWPRCRCWSAWPCSSGSSCSRSACSPTTPLPLRDHLPGAHRRRRRRSTLLTLLGRACIAGPLRSRGVLGALRLDRRGVRPARLAAAVRPRCSSTPSCLNVVLHERATAPSTWRSRRPGSTARYPLARPALAVPCRPRRSG